MEGVQAEKALSVKSLTEDNYKIAKKMFYLLGLTMNISQVFWGINLFVSDIVLFLLFIFLLITKTILLKNSFTLFFMTVTCLRLVATFFLSQWVDFTINVPSIVITGQKFMVSLLYAIVAMSVVTIDRKLRLDFLSGIKTGAMVFGLLSLFLFFFAPNSVRSIVLFGDIRLRGLMNDPNYFAYLQMSGYCIWYFNRYARRVWNVIAPVGFLVSILLSASKTGFIVFLVVNAFLTMKKAMEMKLKRKNCVYLFFIAFVTAITSYLFFMPFIYQLVDMIQLLPQVSRLSELFDNFYTAFSANGSGRNSAWKTAQQLIIETHFCGIGFVDYSTVATAISGSRTIAHNTFFQIAVEWGMLPALFGLLAIGIQMFKKLASRDWLFFMLLLINSLFSFSISLQNARLVWVILGLLMAEKVAKQRRGEN